MLTYIDKNPVKFAQSTCIYTDEKGNIYQVFIRASTKREVLDFIKNNLETGKVKVKAEVIPIDVLENRFKDHRDLVEKHNQSRDAENPIPKDISLDEDNPMDGISIEINPIQVDVPEGSRIVYQIDPTLDRDESAPPVFHQGSTIEVRCTTSDGTIETLVEKPAGFDTDKFTPADFHSSALVAAPASFSLAGNPHKIWKIIVTGRGASNTYVLDYW